MAFDPKCYEVAEAFLPRSSSDRLKAELAQHVHDSIEDWLVTERDRLAAEVSRPAH